MGHGSLSGSRTLLYYVISVVPTTGWLRGYGVILGDRTRLTGFTDQCLNHFGLYHHGSRPEDRTLIRWVKATRTTVVLTRYCPAYEKTGAVVPVTASGSLTLPRPADRLTVMAFGGPKGTRTPI
jgi:hypothetical protein